MKIKVYDGEMYNRGKLWYILFVFVILVFIILSLVLKNYVGIIVILIILSGYILVNVLSKKQIYIQLKDNGIKIGDKFYSFGSVDGFLIEVDENDNFVNLILVIGGNGYIFTFADEKESIAVFINSLSQYLPYLENYQESLLNKIIRLLKI